MYQGMGWGGKNDYICVLSTGHCYAQPTEVIPRRCLSLSPWSHFARAWWRHYNDPGNISARMYGTTSWISDKIATIIPTRAEVLPISNLFYHTDTKPKCLFGRRARWDSTVSFAARVPALSLFRRA